MTKAKQNIKRIGNAAFYAGLMLEMLFVVLDKSDYIIPYETWLFRFTFLLFGVKILCTGYTRKQWGVILGMGLLGVLSFLITDREEIVRLVAFVAAFKGIDVNKAAKVTFFETLAGCLVVVLLSLTGIYGAASVTGHFRGGGVEETRYCLGMGHPNALHCMFFVLLVLGMALYLEKIKWYLYIVLHLFNLGLYMLTDSRTGMLMAAVAIFFAMFLQYGRGIRENKILYILSILFVVFLVLFTVFIAVYGVEFPIFRQIDIRINGRFQWGKSEGGIQFWSLFSSPENQNYMDMGYMKLFYWYGIIPGLLYIGAVCMMIWNCYKTKNYAAFLVIMSFSAYMFIEAHAVSVYLGRNYILLFMGTMWYTLFSMEEKKFGSKLPNY